MLKIKIIHTYIRTHIHRSPIKQAPKLVVDNIFDLMQQFREKYKTNTYALQQTYVTHRRTDTKLYIYSIDSIFLKSTRKTLLYKFIHIFAMIFLNEVQCSF